VLASSRPHHHHHHPPNRTLTQLFGLFAVSFSYALMFATMSNIVIAKEVDKLASTSQTTWVGVIMAVGALAQIITPIAGAWSDKIGGSREPFLKGGTVLVVLGVGVLFLAELISSMIVLFVSQLVISAGLSIQYAMITVTLHDHVNDDQVGQGSAAMATLGILGAGVGYALFAVGLQLNIILIVYACTTIVCFALTMSFMSSTSVATVLAKNTTAAVAAAAAVINHNPKKKDAEDTSENSSNDDLEVVDAELFEIGSEKSKLTATTSTMTKSNEVEAGKKSTCGSGRDISAAAAFCEILLHALTVPSPTTFPDFSLALASRALFNAGLACQGYLVFFFRDVAKIGTLPPEQVVSRLAVLALLGGLVGAVPAGAISDRWGRKPVIFFAAIVCICAIISFPFLSTRTHFDLIGLLFGFGNVAYLSVDYALGVQSLPRKQVEVLNDKETQMRMVPVDAAKDLGVFALSATIGMLIGQLVFAGILERFSQIEPVGKNGAPESRYAPEGFMLTFIVASVFFALSALAAGLIKALK
jgi:MFS family permease